MDWAEQGEGLVKKNKTYLPKREPALPAKEPIDLPTARTVLQTVVDTNEDSLTVSSDLSKVGPYSTQQVRAAFHILTEDILENHPRTGNSLEFRTVKETPHGMVVLVANRKLEYTKGGSIKVIAPIGKIKSISLDA
ncbi:MAG: hypothetical protein M1365_15190, partial [Actinobacteria bacterium]|nr:hypothetical protein [Actinomycetota bacterium]